MNTIEEQKAGILNACEQQIRINNASRECEAEERGLTYELALSACISSTIWFGLLGNWISNSSIVQNIIIMPCIYIPTFISLFHSKKNKEQYKKCNNNIKLYKEFVNQSQTVHIQKITMKKLDIIQKDKHSSCLKKLKLYQVMVEMLHEKNKEWQENSMPMTTDIWNQEIENLGNLIYDETCSIEYFKAVTMGLMKVKK